MINKYIIVIILVLITSFLIKICMKNNQPKNNLPELFENNNEDSSVQYFDKRYDEDNTGFVQFSKDYLKIKIKLSHGYFKFTNATEDYINQKGLLKINLKSNDYREAPFDTFNNITDFLIKYTYFKLDGKIYKIKMQELIDEVLGDRDRKKADNLSKAQQKLDNQAEFQKDLLEKQSDYLRMQEETKQEQQRQEFDLKKIAAQKKCENPLKNLKIVPPIPVPLVQAVVAMSRPFSAFTKGSCNRISDWERDQSWCRTKKDMLSCNFAQRGLAVPGAVCSWTPHPPPPRLFGQGIQSLSPQGEDNNTNDINAKIDEIGEYKVTSEYQPDQQEVNALILEVGEEDTWDKVLDTLSFTVKFEGINGNEPVNFDEELILSELTLQSNIYDDPNAFTDDKVNLLAKDLSDNLSNINEGVPCGWHYDKETGGAGGYFSEIINDPEWQKDNPELYNTLSKYICPHYLPVCTGQRSSGIVEGKCIKIDDNCNNSIVDSIMGYERSGYDVIKRKSAEEVKYDNVMQKNAANRQMLSDALSRIELVLNEPSIETFQNINLNIEENEENKENENIDSEEGCKFRIENKCYENYNDVDKNFYETGGKIFNVLFPTIKSDVFKKLCYNSSKWVSDNIVKILTYKLTIGLIAAILFWGENSNLDFQIRVFKSFISFIFSEIYILYIIIVRVIKPTMVKRQIYRA
jgi:hypothetical protein